MMAVLFCLCQEYSEGLGYVYTICVDFSNVQLDQR
jgi:hypothetical protein